MILASIIKFWQPLSGLVLGVAMLAFAGYTNWYGMTKADIVRWIAKHIFHDKFRSEASADNLFMTATSFLLMFGGIMIVVALLYLNH